MLIVDQMFDNSLFTMSSNIGGLNKLSSFMLRINHHHRIAHCYYLHPTHHHKWILTDTTIWYSRHNWNNHCHFHRLINQTTDLNWCSILSKHQTSSRHLSRFWIFKSWKSYGFKYHPQHCSRESVYISGRTQKILPWKLYHSSHTTGKFSLCNPLCGPFNGCTWSCTTKRYLD